MADFVIIGGGVYGAGVAYWLAENGADVLLLEAKKIGNGASAGPGRRGTRANGRDLRELPLIRIAHEMWPNLHERLGVPQFFERSGHLLLIEREQDVALCEARALLQNRYGWTVGASALLMMPRPGVFSLASPLGGWMPSRIGFRWPVLLGSLSMIVSMIVFTIAAPRTDGFGIGLIVVALCLTGLAAGISQPAIASLSVDSVDEQDMGIANGMNQQITFVGIVGGIQTMSVVLGDDASGGRFAATYLIGLGIAVLAFAMAWFIQEPHRRG